MDRLIRLQAASNYTNLDSRSAGERYVVMYLAPGAGEDSAEATLMLNDEKRTVPEAFAEEIPELLERSGLMSADGLTEWNPDLPPTIGFHALAAEFESGRIFKTSASGFSDVWAAFAAHFVKLVKAQFERAVPGEEACAEEPGPGAETAPASAPEPDAEPATPIVPIDLGPVTDEPAAPADEPEVSETEAPEPEMPGSAEPDEYHVGDEAEEWAPEYDEISREMRTADAELKLVDAELDSADAKLDLAESRLQDMEKTLKAAEAALMDAKAELDMQDASGEEAPYFSEDE